MNIHIQVFVWIDVFNSLGYVSRSGIVGPYDNSVFNFVRNCQTVFQRGCTILHSHQICMKVSVSPHSCQQFLLSVSLFIIAILVDAK